MCAKAASQFAMRGVQALFEDSPGRPDWVYTGAGVGGIAVVIAQPSLRSRSLLDGHVSAADAGFAPAAKSTPVRCTARPRLGDSSW